MVLPSSSSVQVATSRCSSPCTGSRPARPRAGACALGSSALRTLTSSAGSCRSTSARWPCRSTKARSRPTGRRRVALGNEHEIVDGLRGRVLLLSDARGTTRVWPARRAGRWSRSWAVRSSSSHPPSAACSAGGRAPSDAVKIEAERGRADLGELRGRVVTIRGYRAAQRSRPRPEAPSGAAGRCIDDAGGLGMLASSAALPSCSSPPPAPSSLTGAVEPTGAKRKRAASVVTPSHRADDPMVGRTASVSRRAGHVMPLVGRSRPRRRTPPAAALPPPGGTASRDGARGVARKGWARLTVGGVHEQHATNGAVATSPPRGRQLEHP